MREAFVHPLPMVEGWGVVGVVYMCPMNPNSAFWRRKTWWLMYRLYLDLSCSCHLTTPLARPLVIPKYQSWSGTYDFLEIAYAA